MTFTSHFTRQLTKEEKLFCSSLCSFLPLRTWTITLATASNINLAVQNLKSSCMEHVFAHGLNQPNLQRSLLHWWLCNPLLQTEDRGWVLSAGKIPIFTLLWVPSDQPQALTFVYLFIIDSALMGPPQGIALEPSHLSGLRSHHQYLICTTSMKLWEEFGFNPSSLC